MDKEIALILSALVLFAGCNKEKSAEQSAETSASNAAAVSKSAESLATVDVSADTQKLLRQAQAHLESKEFSEAVAVLTEAIKADPNAAQACFLRARILADFGKDAAALADFNKAVELSSDNVDYLQTRGFFFFTRKAFQQSISDFTQVLRLDSKSVAALNHRGIARLTLNDFANATADFTAVLQLEPKNANAFNNRGFAYLRMGEFEKAESDLQQAAEINPADVNTHNNLGLLHFETGEYEQAIVNFTEAITRDRRNANYYASRRECYKKLNKPHEAAADEKKIDWLKKLNELSVAVRQQQERPESYIKRASHLLDGGEEKLALADYERAIEVDPNAATAYSGRAVYWLKQSEYQKAIDDCNRALEIEPHHEAYSVRGDAAFKTGDFAGAVSDYVKAKRIDSSVAEAYRRWAGELEADGQADKAAQARERAKALAPVAQPIAP